jgi:aminopeptidase N
MPVASYSPLEYGAIVYGRGALFFEALADEIGQAAVDDGLRDYFAQNEYGIGTAEEMQAAFETACGCDLQSLFDEWVTDTR